MGTRAGTALALTVLALLAGSATAQSGRVVDTAIASTRGALVTLSDVTLARALGLFGLTPSAGPVTRAEVDRYLDARLAVREAEQVAVAVPAEESARAWEAAGGAALTARLEAAGINAAWARAMIEDDLKVRRFVELRFQAFAFVTEPEVDEALGQGPHDEAARRAARERLRDERAARALAEWTTEARGRTRIRVLDASGGPWPAPFALAPAPDR
ncbi:MAG: hypothetical protein ABW020_10110 [Candidatus Rokuibacteriota bacterium]